MPKIAAEALKITAKPAEGQYFSVQTSRFRLLLPMGREMRQHRVGAFRPDHARQLFAGGAAHTGDAAERGEERLAPPRTDPGHDVELRAQVALRPRQAVERDGEAM